MARKVVPTLLDFLVADGVPRERIEGPVEEFYRERDRLLGERLVERGLVTEHQLHRALAEQAIARGDVGTASRHLANEFEALCQRATDLVTGTRHVTAKA